MRKTWATLALKNNLPIQRCYCSDANETLGHVIYWFKRSACCTMSTFKRIQNAPVQ